MAKRKARLPPGERFITWHHWMIQCPAYRELRGDAVKLMTLLQVRFSGYNNGAISMSVREAARELGCSPNHAVSLFSELRRLRFIDVTERGAFSRKDRKATTFKLNWLGMANLQAASGSDPPTKEFMRLPMSTFKKQRTVPRLDTDGRKP